MEEYFKILRLYNQEDQKNRDQYQEKLKNLQIENDLKTKALLEKLDSDLMNTEFNFIEKMINKGKENIESIKL